MSDIAVTGRSPAWGGDDAAVTRVAWQVPDARRALQLSLGAVWLLAVIAVSQAVAARSASPALPAQQ